MLWIGRIFAILVIFITILAFALKLDDSVLKLTSCVTFNIRMDKAKFDEFVAKYKKDLVQQKTEISILIIQEATEGSLQDLIGSINDAISEQCERRPFLLKHCTPPANGGKIQDTAILWHEHEWEAIEFPGGLPQDLSGLHNRQVVYTLLRKKDGDTKLAVISYHGPNRRSNTNQNLTDNEKMGKLEKLLAWVRDWVDKESVPAIIGGDFNLSGADVSKCLYKVNDNVL
jgi:endonuclease/exonuclease/phosphatase family metal-dependent hydrolase